MKRRVKKVMGIVLALSLGLALTACGSADATDKNESAKQEETEKKEETVKEEKTSEEQTETAEATHETYTEADVIMNEVYDSIKESIKINYLEPNNIAPEEFSFADIVDPLDVDSFTLAVKMPTYEILWQSKPKEVQRSDVPTIESDEVFNILDAAFKGVTNYIEKSMPVDETFISKIFNELDIRANVKFTE